MSIPADTVRKQLDALSLHLRRRRDDLLRIWREAIRQDPELTTSSTLSRSALYDHFPKILDDFGRRLRAEHALDAARADFEQRKDAAEHGMHRWQQGYDIRETMREWGHLHVVLLRELDQYEAGHAEVEPEVMRTAREILATICMEGICESTARYIRLQQAEAASRARDLEASLNALQAVENERAALLRETAHDLRGSVGVIANTSALLAKTDMTAPQRDHFYKLLQQRIRTTGALLNDLVELARLEAGQDPLNIETFDAAARIRECCELLRPIAAERNLFLKCEGPESLPVEGDQLKLQRIAQNLLLNALNATERGGVVVSWAPGEANDAQRWTLSIQDTGPGFALQLAGRFRNALKRATAEAHNVEGVGAARKSEAAEHQRAPLLAAQSGPGSAHLPSGEGIGLSIVKRLCEALNATVELETAPAHGTTVRVILPRRYRSDDSGG